MTPAASSAAFRVGKTQAACFSLEQGMDDVLLVILALVLVGGIVGIAAFAAKRQLPDLFPRQAAARERIRREVHQEFEASIQQSTGLRRWWLILKREREISRRLARIIYGNGAA